MTRPSQSLSIETRWGKPFVAESGGEADLLIRVTAGSAPANAGQRAPVDVAFIIDRSGSMGGGPLEAAKDGVNVALDRLEARDRATLVVFDSEIDLLQELAPVSETNRRAMRAVMQRIEARDSTNLGGGWLSGCQQLAGSVNGVPGSRLRRAILLTDGMANVGITNPVQLAHHAGELRSRGVMTTTLGFGDHFDEQLLSAMAEAGGGNFEYIAATGQLVPFFTRELGEMLSTVATGLTVRITLPDGVRGELISHLPHERTGKAFTITVGDIPGGESIDLLFHVTTAPGRGGPLPAVQVSARWTETAGSASASWHGEPLPLMRSSDAVVAATATDPDVAEKVALQRAANAHREAMRLDRQGRHAESRQMFSATAHLLQSAPQTDRVLFEHGEALSLAEMDQSTGFTEGVHKRTTSRVSRMVRGRRDREDDVR